MNRSTVPSADSSLPGGLDLEQVARRIIKLAEIAMLDHMESLMRSQATGMAEIESGELGRRMHPGH